MDRNLLASWNIAKKGLNIINKMRGAWFHPESPRADANPKSNEGEVKLSKNLTEPSVGY